MDIVSWRQFTYSNLEGEERETPAPDNLSSARALPALTDDIKYKSQIFSCLRRDQEQIKKFKIRLYGTCTIAGVLNIKQLPACKSWGQQSSVKQWRQQPSTLGALIRKLAATSWVLGGRRSLLPFAVAPTLRCRSIAWLRKCTSAIHWVAGTYHTAFRA